MEKSRLIKVSKFLSKYLRHSPKELGIELSSGGWVGVEVLLSACGKKKFPLSLEELNEVVDKNDKKRFSFNEDRTKIKANQGHSVQVELEFKASTPPGILYHGTGEKSADIILKEGIKKMARHHVHLSSDFETAEKVGARHGKPVVFEIDSSKMFEDGFSFFLSDNEVWLVDFVPPKFINKVGR